jgi:deazaflavin-dependent oxidoreductase (nitroreductase family)
MNGQSGDGDTDSFEALAAEDYLYLSTTGRVTGAEHRIEIWFALRGRTAYLLAGGGDGSDWVRNIGANPSVRVRLGDRELAATARVLRAGTEEESRARTLLFEKYAGGYSGDLTSWRDSALPVALDLDEGC